MRFWFVFMLLYGLLALGPMHPSDTPVQSLPRVPTNLAELQQYVQKKEERTTYLRPQARAEIVWADSIPRRTRYVLLYLHGFSASKFEGEPLHRALARAFGANLYLPRLHEHGRKAPDNLLTLTAETYSRSAAEALAVAQQLGEEVIVLGTSTGGSLALWLAAQFPEAVQALLLYSPNVRIADPAARLLTGPWGKQMAQVVYKGDYRTRTDADSIERRHWQTHYRIEGLIGMQALLDETMQAELFRQVRQPTLVLYNNSPQGPDPTVSVKAIEWMYSELGAQAEQKQLVGVDAPNEHVLTTPWRSAAAQEAFCTSYRFLAQLLEEPGADHYRQNLPRAPNAPNPFDPYTCIAPTR